MSDPRPQQSPRDWHACSLDDALRRLESSPERGLDRTEAARRLSRYGPNALPEVRRRSLFFVFVQQFQSPLIYLLMVAAVIAFVLGESHDAFVIVAVMTLNAVIGAYQEGRAERSLAALRRLSSVKARIVRGGEEELVEARELVPGDVLLLAAGDAVGADARVLDDAALEVAEATLTGESIPVAKNHHALDPDTLLADRRNMVYAGTHVTAGRARALVVATGLDTEIGAIAQLAERAEEPPTPLESRIAQLGRQIVVAALAMVALVNAIGFVRGLAFIEIFMIAISQMVSMVPEGLPVAMTVALAVGVQRMAHRRAIVRRLSAVEVLGSTTVICSDKTGTLTRNEMTATALYLPGGRRIDVSGAGYAPEGGFVEAGRVLDAGRDAALVELLEAVALCNDAQVVAPDEHEPAWRALGDPTEAALVTLALKGGVTPARLAERMPRRAELPFDPAAKMMATQHAAPSGPVVFVKGAPEAIEELCARVGERRASFGAAERADLQAAADAMASRALRLLAIARVDGVELDARAGFAALRARATLLGLVGQIDPPRPEVADAVRACGDAGIRPVMVTGDHKATGLAVARTLGIARDGDLAVDGRELEALSDAELAERLDRISVFARVHPAQKLRIVGAYQARGDVVAMTGDGVNDAPALAQADVGVAMGITGTEVAKQAAKIVVTDDNFATIVGAVAEGRLIHRNIKNLLLYLFSTSISGVLVLTVALLLGYPSPLAAVQILWINVLIDGLVTVNFAMDPPMGDEMRLRPVPRSEPVVTRALLSRLLLLAPAMAATALGWFVVRTAMDVPFEQVRTETFTVLAVCQWFNVLNCRSDRHSALDASLLRNRWLIGGVLLGNLLHVAVIFWEPLGRVFHTVPISFELVPAIGLAASFVLWVEELRKWRVRRRERASSA